MADHLLDRVLTRLWRGPRGGVHLTQAEARKIASIVDYAAELVDGVRGLDTGRQPGWQRVSSRAYLETCLANSVRAARKAR